MARWRLMNAHYLNVPGTEWEYVEISRASGKQARVRFPVPQYLDPRDAADHNYPGEIVVAYAKEGEKVSKFYPKDIIFLGQPTPDMEPMDEEAEAISNSFKAQWIGPMSEQALPGYGDYSQSLLAKFDEELTAAIQRVGTGKIATMPNTSVKQSDFDRLQKQVEELTKQNAALLAKLTEKPEVKAK